MTEGAYRVKQWHEQKTARGECHGPRCRKPATGYFCESCKRKLSGIAAQVSMKQRVTKKFLHDWECLMRGVCLVCEQPSRTAIHSHCKARKFPYATRQHARPLIVDATSRPAMATVCGKTR